jgi:hypothetical protein
MPTTTIAAAISTSMLTTTSIHTPMRGLTINPKRNPNRHFPAQNSMLMEIASFIPRCGSKNVDLTSGTFFTKIVPYVVVRMEIEKESMMTRVIGVVLRKGSHDFNNPKRTIFEEDHSQKYDPCRGELFAPLAELVALI